MIRKAVHKLLALFIMIGLALSLLPAGRALAAATQVTGKFTRNGLKLAISSQGADELLWRLHIKYCDGTSDEFGLGPLPGKFGPNLSQGYILNVEKPMQRVVVTSLPFGRTTSAPNVSATTLRRSCAKQEPLPKLACKDVQVDAVFQRSWEGKPISFKSNARVAFAGLKFPGVDGLAPVKESTFNRIYAPSLHYDSASHTWSGTFISLRVPTGSYQRVMLVVEDIYGQQAKCPAGDITVLP